MLSWVYQSEDDLEGSSYWGLIDSYDGGGFVQDLASTQEDAFVLLKPLFDNLWLDHRRTP